MIGSKHSASVGALFKKNWYSERDRAKKDWASFDAKGNVYLIGSKPLGWYKIGLTRDCEAPDKRFKTIQHGVPFEIDYLKYWFVSHAGSFEKLLHYEFRENVIRGEWFSFSAEVLPSIVIRIQELADQVPAMVKSLEDQIVAG